MLARSSSAFPDIMIWYKLDLKKLKRTKIVHPDYERLKHLHRLSGKCLLKKYVTFCNVENMKINIIKFYSENN